jgi:hypothetical protein
MPTPRAFGSYAKRTDLDAVTSAPIPRPSGLGRRLSFRVVSPFGFFAYGVLALLAGPCIGAVLALFLFAAVFDGRPTDAQANLLLVALVLPAFVTLGLVGWVLWRKWRRAFDLFVHGQLSSVRVVEVRDATGTHVNGSFVHLGHDDGRRGSVYYGRGDAAPALGDELPALLLAGNPYGAFFFRGRAGPLLLQRPKS